MKQTVQKNIQNGLEFLAVHQFPNGKFAGRSGRQQTDTVFFTALILDCLATIPEAAALRAQSAKYLLANRGAQWSWNYWERSSRARAYPDDLDDTACSIAALIKHDARTVDAAAQANLARNLINCEVQPGGPYTTWLAAPDLPAWRDVDIAVNANVGYMLCCLGVDSPALNDYVSRCIVTKRISSPYYVGIVPVLYFLSRWYAGSQKAQLITIVLQELSTSQEPLHTAMLVSAACNLGQVHKVDRTKIQELLVAQRKGSWPASPLYYEPPKQGKRQYAASRELTTAFVVEALQAWSSSSYENTNVPVAQHPKTLDQLFDQQVHELVAAGRPEVTAPANIFADALGGTYDAEQIHQLNQGSLHGWLAYTLYDDFLDHQGDPRLLGVASMAMRQALRHFTRALPSSTSFARFVYEAFDTTDRANTWEVLHARNVGNLPDYVDLHQLAQRSWGHVIAPTGVMVMAGYKLGGKEVRLVHKFMHHYLVARQLCDDAHDWQEDLVQGRISVVVARLMAACPNASSESRQLYFWQHTIHDVNKLIRQHIQVAQSQLEACEFFTDKRALQGWLEAVERSCKRAEQGRDDALLFIQTFNTLGVVPHGHTSGKYSTCCTPSRLV